MMKVSTKGIHIICYYAQEDKTLHHELLMHLSVLKRHGLIAQWDDCSIEAEKEEKMIDLAYLKEADIILLLISPNFLTSAFCDSSEIKNLLRLHKIGRIQVIPIILHPVALKDSPLSNLEEFPPGGKAIISWSNIDEGFYRIVKALHGVIQKHLDKKRLLSEGDVRYENNEYEKALAAYEQTLRLNPNDAEDYQRALSLEEKMKGPEIWHMSHNQRQLAGEEDARVKTVLVVADDTSIGNFLVQIILQETFHHALLVTDGFQALSVVANIKPNLFILNYPLPRMNGIELYDQLHAMPGLEQIPAIVISARLPRQEIEKRKIIAMSKPPKPDDFLNTIEKLLG